MNIANACSDLEMFFVKCRVDTGVTEPVDFLVATFYKKVAAEDYVDLLNNSINDDLFITYYILEDKK